jgi:hypothetical protein
MHFIINVYTKESNNAYEFQIPIVELIQKSTHQYTLCIEERAVEVRPGRRCFYHTAYLIPINNIYQPMGDDRGDADVRR